MKIRDVMTTNVVTIPSNTSIADAKKIMKVHKIERLPVVDKQKLVGIVTERRLENVSPSKATSLTVWEVSYLLNTTPVKDIMEKDVITVLPDMNVEEGVALAQSSKVGSLVVLEDNRVVGMATTNDFFYKIVNPILGLGEPGSRLEITNGGGSTKTLADIVSIVSRLGYDITTLHIEVIPDTEGRDLCIHVTSEDVSQLKAELERQGYKVSIRAR